MGLERWGMILWWLLKPKGKYQSASVVKKMSMQGGCSVWGIEPKWLRGVCVCVEPKQSWTQVCVAGLYIGGASKVGSCSWKESLCKRVGPSGISEPGQDEKGTFPIGIQHWGLEPLRLKRMHPNIKGGHALQQDIRAWEEWVEFLLVDSAAAVM